MLTRHGNIFWHRAGNELASYKELKEQGEALLRQAEEARKQELNDIIENIRAQVAEHGLTVDDIFGRRKRGAAPKKAATKSALPPKYQDPKTGATWSGHGRAPAWICDAKNRDKFLIPEA